MAIVTGNGRNINSREPSDQRTVQPTKEFLSKRVIPQNLQVYETDTGKVFAYVGPWPNTDNVPANWKELPRLDVLEGFDTILSGLQQGFAPSAVIGLTDSKIPFAATAGASLGSLRTTLTDNVEWEIVRGGDLFELADPSTLRFPYSLPFQLRSKSDPPLAEDGSQRIVRLKIDPVGSLFPLTVRAREGAGTWHTYTFLFEKDIAPPAKPENIALIEATNSTLEIGWFDRATNEIGYIARIQGQANKAVAANSESYKFSGLVAHTDYTIELYAYNRGGDSPIASLTVKTTPQPTNLMVSHITATSVRLEAGFRGNNITYYIERENSTGGWDVIYASSAGTVYNDNTLTANTSYRYRVQTGNISGRSAYSTPITVTTLAN